jgi:hypothetical protein
MKLTTHLYLLPCLFNVTELGASDVPGGKGRPERRADSLTAVPELISRQYGSFDLHGLVEEQHWSRCVQDRY